MELNVSIIIIVIIDILELVEGEIQVQSFRQGLQTDGSRCWSLYEGRWCFLSLD